MGAYEQSDLYGLGVGTIMKLKSQGFVQINNFQKSEKESITVYPNPSSGTTIIVELDLKSFTGNHFPFRLFSAEGKLMQSSHINVEIGTYKVDVSNFPPGVYYIVSTVGSARFIKMNQSF